MAGPSPAAVPSDAELMERAGRGEVEAFAAIYDRHAPALHALAQRMLRSAGEAQDLVHDVFLEAWQNVREYDPSRASARTWLLVRARSRALDRLARRAREHDARAAMPSGDAPPLLHRAAASEDQRYALQQALAAIDPNVRTTLELTYFEGLTADEIAEHMQVPAGTVKSRLARGLQQLAAILDDLDGTEGSHDG